MSKIVTLTAPEKAERADELAAVLEEIQQVEKTRKDVNAEFRNQLKLLNDKARELARVVRTGLEERDTERQISMAEFEEVQNGTNKKPRRNKRGQG